MRSLAALAVLLAVTACRPAEPGLTDADRARIHDEINQVTDALMVTWNAMDLDGYVTFLSPSRLALAWGGTIHRDIPSFRLRQQEWFDAREAWEGAWVGKTIEVLSSDAVLFQGEYECTQHLRDGRVLHWPGNASWTVLFRLEDGDWKMTFTTGTAGASQSVEVG